MWSSFCSSNILCPVFSVRVVKSGFFVQSNCFNTLFFDTSSAESLLEAKLRYISSLFLDTSRAVSLFSLHQSFFRAGQPNTLRKVRLLDDTSRDVSLAPVMVKEVELMSPPLK